MIFLPSARTNTYLLKTPLLETHSLLLTLHYVGSLVFPVIGCTLAHAGKVIWTPTLEASPSSSWTCILVGMCLIPALGARRSGLCLRRVSRMARPLILHAELSWTRLLESRLTLTQNLKLTGLAIFFYQNIIHRLCFV